MALWDHSCWQTCLRQPGATTNLWYHNIILTLLIAPISNTLCLEKRKDNQNQTKSEEEIRFKLSKKTVVKVWCLPSGSRSRAMPKWSSAVEKACSRLALADWFLTFSKSIKSGRIVWTMALKAKPSRQLLPKSDIFIPYFLIIKSKNQMH